MPPPPAGAAAAPAAPAAAVDPSAASDQRMAALEAKLTKNGGRDAGYLWSQERDEVIISVIAPPKTKAKDIAVVVDAQTMFVALTGGGGGGGGGAVGQVLLKGELAHPIAPEPRDDDEMDYDVSVWAVHLTRYQTLTLSTFT